MYDYHLTCFQSPYLLSCLLRLSILLFQLPYLPYKVYALVVIMGGLRIDMTVFYSFTIISFFNRCLNPFIYASQYEVMRRFWSPLVEFLRRHVARKPRVAAAIMIEPMPSTSAVSHPAGQELPLPVP